MTNNAFVATTQISAAAPRVNHPQVGTNRIKSAISQKQDQVAHVDIGGVSS